MSDSLFAAFRAAGITGLEAFTEADAALARITKIYDKGVAILREAFARFTRGELPDGPVDAFYPFLGLELGREQLNLDARLAYGALHDPGVYGTTLTRPSLFGEYYRHQIDLLLQHHGAPVRGRHQRPADAAAVRDRGEHGRHPPRPGGRAPDRLSVARHEPDRRCDRQRHLPAAAGHAQAARSVHRRAGRLLARAPAPLHGDRARARPALHPADQLSALRRALHRLRRAGDPGGRRLSGLRRARRRDHAQPAPDRPGGRRAAAAPSAADAGLPSDPARADGRDHGQHRHRPVERAHDHRPSGGAAAALLADARPLRRPQAQPAARATTCWPTPTPARTTCSTRTCR